MSEGKGARSLEELKRILERAGIDVAGLQGPPGTGTDSDAESQNLKVYSLPTANKSAMALWEKLRDLSDETGYWPVLNEYREPGQMEFSNFESTLLEAERLDADEWFKEQLAEEKEELQNPERLNSYLSWVEAVKEQYQDPRVVEHLKQRQAELEKMRPGTLDQLRAGGDPLRKLLYGLDMSPSKEDLVRQQEAESQQLWDMDCRNCPESVLPSSTIGTSANFIDLIPARLSWQVPAFSAFPPANNYWGGARCIHMAVLKKWHAEYGAELVVCSGATYEFLVSRPPATREAALKLALEHYLYCVDCVTQSNLPATIKHRAASIFNARTWYFWWD